MTHLDVFQRYDAYQTIAAQRTLNREEKAFYSYCSEHHDILCDGQLSEYHRVIKQATKLFDEIP